MLYFQDGLDDPTGLKFSKKGAEIARYVFIDASHPTQDETFRESRTKLTRF